MVLPSHGRPEDVLHCGKPTKLLVLRDETENACAPISMNKVSEAAVCCTNKCLQNNGYHFEHLL